MKKKLSGEEIVRRIKKALARDGDYTWDDLVECLRNKTAQVFWNDYGAWVTQVIPAPQHNHLNVWVVAGELPEVMDLQPQVLAFAREQNCKYVTATARKGWLRDVAPSHGWKEKAVLIAHEV